MAAEATRYGFVWALPDQPDVIVERTAGVEVRRGEGEHRIITIACGDNRVEVTVSPQGRSITARQL